MKKKIDKVFQDRFHDLESAPPIGSWEIINAALPKKKKRKFIFLWYEMVGAAAALAFLFTLFNSPLNKKKEDNSPSVTFEYKEDPLHLIPFLNDFQDSINDTTVHPEYVIQEFLKSPSVQSVSTKQAAHTQKIDVTGSTNVVQEELNPLISNSRHKPVSHLLTHIDKILADHSRNSTLATTETNEKLNGIDLIEYLKNQKEKETDFNFEDNSGHKRLSIRTTAGAVYFDNLGKGNSLDPQFENNQTNGEFTMAYGINVAYKLNPKLHIRTGVGKVHLSQNTNNIEFEVAILSESLNPQEIHTPLLVSSDASNGYVNQTLEYIEIPLELAFTLLDKKIGFSLIGGASAFFLDTNRVSHISPVSKTELGGANNLNSISYSANFGLGLDYNFSSQFQLNLEPILKYQINTYTGGEGLNPYIFGIYSGLTYKF